MSKLLWRAALYGAVAVLPSVHASAQALTDLTAFNIKDGANPHGSLIADSKGNLYGTTLDGGAFKDGTVFELSPPAAGQTAWTETVLLSFNGTKTGEYPYGSLIADSAGNLYGTAEGGGAGGCGVVFELSPPAAGKTAWTETVLFSFNLNDGNAPEGSLIADSEGNLYGTTVEGGVPRGGVVFELSPPAAGQTAWTETVLYSFEASTGAEPSGSLLADSAGNLYGMTTAGGTFFDGIVFEISPPAAGQTAWTETVLTEFGGKNGSHPYGSLIADRQGNLYGTTTDGGTTARGKVSTRGTVFELTPPEAGQTAWTETILTSFDGTDGTVPEGSLIADSEGNLYGTTEAGGPFKHGTVFELTPPPAGQTAWTESVLASFNKTDGEGPIGSLIADGEGNLYGTTTDGGADHHGTVFKLMP
jgi:uncharacterized repeat protein (TIGR03803 family)